MRLSKVEYHHRCSPSNPTSKKAKTPIDRGTFRANGGSGPERPVTTVASLRACLNPVNQGYPDFYGRKILGTMHGSRHQVCPLVGLNWS